MANGKQWLLYEGYTFFYRYLTRTGHKWVCTRFPRCKGYLCVDDNLNIIKCSLIHTHEMKTLHLCADGKYSQLITMVNNKTLVLYEGFTFYRAGKKKGYVKWVCTSFPHCKSYVLTDSNMYIHEANNDHHHVKKNLFKTNDGKYIRI